MTRSAALASIAFCALGCSQPTHTTCTGHGVEECGPGKFCVVVEGADASVGQCLPVETYRCSTGTGIQGLCDDLRGSRSCAVCLYIDGDPDAVSILWCASPEAPDCHSP